LKLYTIQYKIIKKESRCGVSNFIRRINMNKTDVLALINSNPMLQLATVDKKGLPHTRGMLLYSADETGIVFHTGSFKPVYSELKHQPHVELSFFDMKKGDQVRVAGVAQEIEDDEFKEKIVNTPGREFLKPVIAAKGYSVLKVFKIVNCKAVVWNMASNLEYPKPEIVF
jgi:pyridoxamine 5'-phosphate oxidase